MATFKEAILNGLNAAKVVGVQRKEIQDVIASLKEAVLAATSGIVSIEVGDIPKHPSELLISSLAAFFKSDPEYGLVIRNVAFPQFTAVAIAQWKPSPAGAYPCGVVFERNEYTCHDKQSLESTLLEILGSASVGVEIAKLASRRPTVTESVRSNAASLGKKPQSGRNAGAHVAHVQGAGSLVKSKPTVASAKSTVKPATKKVAIKPSVKKSSAKPVAKSSAAKAVAKPLVKKPASKSAAKKTVKPAAKKPVAKPAAKKPAAKPAAKAALNPMANFPATAVARHHAKY